MTPYFKEPHELTLAQFITQSKAVPLQNHGRKWDVIFRSRALGFSDADTADAAIADMHRCTVSNALYLNTLGAPELDDERPSLPPAEVLAEYPDLVAQFSELGLGGQPHDEVQELIDAARPFADLLEEDHPEGTVFELEVHASDVARLKAALRALGQ